MYIPDGCEGVALCRRYLRLFLDGREPPWWPSHRQRQELLVARLFGPPAAMTAYELPEFLCEHIAAFSTRWWVP